MNMPIAPTVAQVVSHISKFAESLAHAVPTAILGYGQEVTVFRIAVPGTSGIRSYALRVLNPGHVLSVPDPKGYLNYKMTQDTALFDQESLCAYFGIEATCSPAGQPHLFRSLYDYFRLVPETSGDMTQWRIKFETPFETSMSEHLFPVMELVDPYLTARPNRKPGNPQWLAALDFLQNTLSGIKLLGSKDKIHGDIKPANTQLSAGSAPGHLGDIGCIRAAGRAPYGCGNDNKARGLSQEEQLTQTHQTDLANTAIATLKVLVGANKMENGWKPIETRADALQACQTYLASCNNQNPLKSMVSALCTMLDEQPVMRGTAAEHLETLTSLDMLRHAMYRFVTQQRAQFPGDHLPSAVLGEALKNNKNIETQNVLQVLYHAALPETKEIDYWPTFVHHLETYLSSVTKKNNMLDDDEVIAAEVDLTSAAQAMRNLAYLRSDKTIDQYVLSNFYHSILNMQMESVEPQDILRLATLPDATFEHRMRFIRSLIEAGYLNTRDIPEHVLRARCELLAARTMFSKDLQGMLEIIVSPVRRNTNFSFDAWARAMTEIKDPLERNRIAVALWEGNMFKKQSPVEADAPMTFNEWIEIVQHYAAQSVNAA